MPSEPSELARVTLAQVNIDELVEGVLASFWERPEFRAARPSRDEMVELVRMHIDLVLRWFLDGRPPTDGEWEQVRDLARMLAAAGVPVDATLANYRLGARFAWRVAGEAAGDVDPALLIEGGDLLFECVDRISSVFAAAYEEGVRATPEAAHERAAQTLLGRLCRGEDLLAQDDQLAQQIGVDLGSIRHAFIVTFPERSLFEHAALARQLRQQGALAVAQGAEGACVVGVGGAPLRWPQLESRRDAIIAEVAVPARSAVGPALEGLRTVVEIAREQGRRGVVRDDDVLLELLLRHAPAIAAQMSERVYGGLSDELTQTLDVLVEQGFDRGQAATALPAHRNTLRNRLDRIRDLTGVDVDEVDGQTLTRLAWLHRRAGRGPHGGAA